MNPFEIIVGSFFVPTAIMMWWLVPEISRNLHRIANAIEKGKEPHERD
jgi:hypothetical protein